MIRTVFIVVVIVHGLIHLLGFAKAFGYAELPQLTQPIPRGLGLIWLAASLVVVASAAGLLLWPRGWWLLGALALVVSQGVILSSWRDAKVGTLANLVLLLGVLYGLASRGPWSLRAEFERSAHPAGPVASPGTVLTEADLASLPDPVRQYVRGSGALGQPRLRSFRATWTGRIRSSASAPWMAFTAEQVNRLDSPQRHFLMDATMKGLPVDVLHAFDERGATMRVRLLSVVPMVDAKGTDLTRAETVTLFNDLCILAPGALVSPLITWEPRDARRARARFTLRGNSISAELTFNDRGELVNFASDDRFAGSPDGKSFTRMRWTTPLSDYAQVGPARVATRGDAVWHPNSGAYAYGEFRLTALVYNPGP
jgi:hypothetical protein